MKPDKSAIRRPAPVAVAVLAFPETTASVVFGLYDLFVSAGRDWGLVLDGQPGPELDAPDHRQPPPRAIPGRERSLDRAAGGSRRRGGRRAGLRA